MPTPSPIAFLLRGRVRRGLAVLLGAIVFSLGLLAFAPDAHATLHDDQHEGGDSCVVELFAQGITTVVAAPLVEAPPLRGDAPLPVSHERLAPRFSRLHPPACGPPSA